MEVFQLKLSIEI